MFKGTPELIEKRREEIISACERLYQTMSFREITLKDIGSLTEFSRPTIYNYFHTKEEIFLALYRREYDRWNDALRHILEDHETLTSEQIADQIARSLQERGQLLRLLSMNNYDMEENSRPELLREFKESYGASITVFTRILKKFCLDMSDEEIQNCIYMFYPFMFGIYPYTQVTEKQRIAMNEAKVGFSEHTIYELTDAFMLRMLGNEKQKNHIKKGE